MAAEQNKVYLPVLGRAVIDRPLEVLDRSPVVDLIVLVIRPADRQRADAAIARVVTSTPVTVVDGGTTRTGSELAGLAVVAALDPVDRPDLVMIHDAARPFLTVMVCHVVPPMRFAEEACETPWLLLNKLSTVESELRTLL